MKPRFMRLYAAGLSLMMAMAVMTQPVLAAMPGTGDPQGQRLGWIIGVLALSAVVLVGVLVFGKKKKK